jgi:predicted permease
MPILPRLFSLWRNLFHKTRKEQELTEEIDAYLEMLVEQKTVKGLDPAEARRQALIEVGGVEQVKERIREARMGHHLETLWQDVRYAARSLRKHALLSIIVIATLTLGIGVSTGVFGYYNAEFLRPRLYKNHDSFARVYAAYTKDPTRPGRYGAATLEDYLAFGDGAKSLRNLAAYADFRAPLGKDDPVEARALLASCNFFSLFDLERPLMGRLPQPEDCSAANQVVVLSERLWRNRFVSDPQIVGKVVHFNGQPVTVVGVTPVFAGEIPGDAWLPYTLETYLKHGDDLQRPGEAVWLNIVGRLNPGFSHRDAAAELKLLASQQDRLHPGRTTTLTVTDGSSIQEPEDRGNIMLVFAVILGALIFFVLIACVNAATLLLARAAARRQEIAVRLALGAGRTRLIRMLLTETFLLAAIASLAGFYLAYHIPDVLNHWLTSPGGATDYSQAPDWRVFGYLAAITILAGAMSGLTPALQSLKVNLTEMLKGRQSVPGGGKGSWLYGLLIGAQVALSFFLLCGAGFFVSVAWKAASFDPGFETRQTLEAGLYVQRIGMEPRNWDSFYRDLTDRITAMPGVQSVAYSYRFAYSGSWTIDVQASGQALRQAEINPVSSNYFATLGISIVSGRAIRENDPPCDRSTGRTMCAVVVSQRLAREFWPGENPLGQTLRTSDGNTFEVVGVARDISSARIGGPDEPMIYRLLSLNNNYPPHPIVRFSGDGASLARSITAAARELAPELVVRVRTIEANREELTEDIWRVTRLIVVLCAMAVILAVIGIYGVVAFAVSRRTKEMGIRIALGASSKDIYRAVLGTSGRSIAIGLLVGLAISLATWLAVAPLFRDVEFAVNVLDPVIYAMTAILLAGVALSAMLGPARRATHVDPMMVLRDE